jgi:aminoglycoside 3-N-acetyltransferase
MTDDLASRPPGSAPIGGGQLAAEFGSLGLRPGQDLLIHCSLRRIGPIDGGAATLLDALRAVSGPEATFVVPTQTTLNSLTSSAFLAATIGLDTRERARYIAAMPGFDPAVTPSTGMGAFAEHLRTRSAAIRSGHPQVSFAAIGPRAGASMAIHDLDCHLGERSPLGWLYAAGAGIVLLGVGYSVCTAFHLAEYRLPGIPRKSYLCYTCEGDERVEHEFTGLDLDDSDFARLGAAFESACRRDVPSAVRRGKVGGAVCRLISLRAAVDFACSWMAGRRNHALQS